MSQVRDDKKLNDSGKGWKVRNRFEGNLGVQQTMGNDWIWGKNEEYKMTV